MTTDFTKEWCMRMAQLEADAEIGAGALAIDPTFDVGALPAEQPEEARVAFARFVRLMRRSRGLSVEKLADDADVDVAVLVGIEEDGHYRPDLRTVYQLANFFGVPRDNLMQVAGLTIPRDDRLTTEAVRFAARSESVAKLTPEEKSALDAFVAVLSEKQK